jgi:hypothetical protein
VVSNTVALTSALANTGVDRIVLAPGTYILNAELSITRSVVLEAAVAGSVVLDAQASSSNQRRALSINPGSSGVVQLIGLNITRGYAQNGGGVYVQGGTVVISSCTISGNQAPNFGGGVYVDSGTVTITSSSIYGNTAGGYSTGYGGGVYISSGTVTITSSSIYGNAASIGGGVYAGYSGRVTISTCTISGNTADQGGGVCASYTPVTITSSSIYRNTATGWGGGVYVYYATVTITSSSITGNTVSGSFHWQGGGGVYVDGTVAISSCTISGNTAAYVRTHAQKFPSPHKTHVLLVVCRAAVSMSTLAPWPSHGARYSTMGSTMSTLNVCFWPPLAPGQRTSPTTLAPSQLAQHRPRPYHRKPHRPRPHHHRCRPPARRRAIGPPTPIVTTAAPAPSS